MLFYSLPAEVSGMLKVATGVVFLDLNFVISIYVLNFHLSVLCGYMYCLQQALHEPDRPLTSITLSWTQMSLKN